VAGDGQLGFSGDGRPATEAELRLTAFSGLAVGKDGSLYIGDSGNDRVRAVAPDGRMTTVLGNGKGGGPPTSSAALEASVGPIEGLTIGPEGDLYAAAQKGIVHLTKQGTILWAAGSVTPQLLPPCGASCNPAGESDFAACDSLAFDASGDLFCSGGPGIYAVYEVAAEPPGAAGQTLSYVGKFRGDGAPSVLSGAPDGSVVMSYRGGVVRLTADGTTTPITTLDGVLGTGEGHPNVFIGGDGLAIGPDGSIYVDTNTGNTFTTVSAIVRFSAAGTSPTILWES
jgi:serine/threonine protein kinase, bacterial